MNRNFSTIVFRNSASILAAQIAIKIISFVFSVLIIRKLGASTFGQYTAILAFGAVFTIFSDFGLSLFSTREVARMRKEEDSQDRINSLYSNILVMRMSLAIGTSIMIIIAAWLTRRPAIMIGAIALNTIGLFLYSIQGSIEAVLAGFERLGQVAITKVIYQLVFVLLGAIVLIMGFGYFGLITANLIGIGTLTILCWRVIQREEIKYVRIDSRRWLSLLRSSIPFGLIGFALGLSYKFDTLLLNIFRSDAETGHYNAAYNLVFSVVLLSNVINTALFPSMTKEVASQPNALFPIYHRVLKYLLSISLPITIGGWILAEPIVKFLYGSGYLETINALKIIIWVVPFMYLSEFLGYVVILQDNERKVSQSVFISTSINIALNLLLVPRFGLIAASVMTVVTEIVLVLLHCWSLRTIIVKTDWIRVFLKPFIAGILMGIITIIISNHTHFLISITIGCLFYFSSTYILRVWGKDDYEIISKAMWHK